jgi:Lrp/AsnC family transcriptional regulator, leucine-responsive regulatory protein
MESNIRINDSIDSKILNILSSNARETQVEIARTVGLAPSAVLERIRKLEARKVIRGYTALIDPAAVDQRLLAFVAVRSEEGPTDDNVAKELATFPEVLEVHHVAGEDCYLVKVRARDAEQLGVLLRTRIGRISGVVSTRTTIVLETVKETSRLPIPQPDETVASGTERAGAARASDASLSEPPEGTAAERRRRVPNR